MDPKSKVVKSKSSNATARINRSNKTTASNAEFKGKVLKKRGVYVEKKITKTNLNSKDNDQIDEIITKPTRKRFGQNNLASSVFNLLSKSQEEPTYGVENGKTIHPRKFLEKSSRYDNIAETVNDKTKRKKYKSKILNKQLNEPHQVVVLRSKTDIYTPSIYSDRSNIEVKWSDFSRLVKDEEDDSCKKTPIHHCIADGLSKITAKQVAVNAESSEPIVKSNIPNRLELYNKEIIKTESISSMKRVHQITESVHIFHRDEKSFYDIAKPKNKVNDYKTQLIRAPVSDHQTPLKCMRKNICNHEKMPHAQRYFLPTKKSNIKTKKDLLNIFKEQLAMTTFVEEPENLYEALKIMAKYRKKSHYLPVHENQCWFMKRNSIYPKKINKRDNGIKKRINFSTEDGFAEMEQDLDESNCTLKVFDSNRNSEEVIVFDEFI